MNDVLVLQNVDNLYWRLQERGLEGVEAIRVRQKQFCVFNTTPLEKYESFRQYLHECTGDEDAAGDWTRFVHTLIEGMFEFLQIENGQNLEDCLPKVYSEITPERLPGFLSQQDVRTSQIRTVKENLQESGTSYIPELNSMFIDRFSLDSAAEETARFVFHACRGAAPPVSERDSDDLFFLGVIERALGYFCSKLFDSSRDGIEALSERVLDQMGYNNQFARTVSRFLDPAKKPSVAHFENLKDTITEHAGRQKLMSMLTQMLGYALGRKLHRAFLESRISRKEIQALFQDPFAAPQDPLIRYVELNNRLV